MGGTVVVAAAVAALALLLLLWRQRLKAPSAAPNTSKKQILKSISVDQIRFLKSKSVQFTLLQIKFKLIPNFPTAPERSMSCDGEHQWTGSPWEPELSEADGSSDQRGRGVCCLHGDGVYLLRLGGNQVKGHRNRRDGDLTPKEASGPGKPDLNLCCGSAAACHTEETTERPLTHSHLSEVRLMPPPHLKNPAEDRSQLPEEPPPPEGQAASCLRSIKSGRSQALSFFFSA